MPGELCLRDPEAEARRKRGLNIFRATLGGAIVMGVGFIVAGLLYWPSTATEPAIYPIGAGTYVAAVCIGGLVWFTRLPGRTIVSLRQTDNGIQARLQNNTTLSAEWNSPRVAFDLSKVPPSPRNPTGRYWFVWKMDRAVVGCWLSEAGWSQLMAAAHLHGLQVTEKVFGKAPNLQTIFNVRAAGARK